MASGERLWRPDATDSGRLILAFLRLHKLMPQSFDFLTKRLLVLDEPSREPIGSSRLQRYADQHIKAAREGIKNNCFTIALAAVEAGGLTGRMHTDWGTEGFVGYDNHCVNYDVLPDNSLVSVDLTASANIDRGQGVFDVLAIRAGTAGDLRQRLGQLYGGDWQIEETPTGTPLTNPT